jgi:hypothetical protein
MYAFISTKRDIDRSNASNIAAVIRSVVTALTTANFNKSSLNASVIDISKSAVLDNKTPNWSYQTSNVDGETLGSGTVSGADNSWTIANGSKTVTFTITDTSMDGYGEYGIGVTSTTSPVSYPLLPGADLIFVMGAGNVITIQPAVGLTTSV